MLLYLVVMLAVLMLYTAAELRPTVVLSDRLMFGGQCMSGITERREEKDRKAYINK